VGGGSGAHQFLGLHNFFEAPALYGVPREVQLVVCALFALPSRRRDRTLPQREPDPIFVSATLAACSDGS